MFSVVACCRKLLSCVRSVHEAMSICRSTGGGDGFSHDMGFDPVPSPDPVASVGICALTTMITMRYQCNMRPVTDRINMILGDQASWILIRYRRYLMIQF